MKRKSRYTRYIPAAMVALCVVRANAHPGLHHDIEAVTQQLDRTPDRVALLVERGRLFRLDDNPTASLVDLERAKTLDANDNSITLELGLTLSALGRGSEAEQRLTQYIQHGGQASDAYAERAGIRSRNKQTKPAIDDYSAAITRSGDLDHYLARGLLQEHLGLLDDAAAGYRDGLDRSGGSVALRLALIRVQTARTRYDNALALIDEVAAQARVKTQWYLRRADVLEAAGRANDAHSERQHALAEADRVLTRRRTAINLTARARVYLALDRVEQARADLNAAIEKAPRFQAAQSLMAKLQRQRPSAAGGDR